MNIFVLDSTPNKSAIQQCDVHIRKMIVESAQMLSTAHRVLDGDNDSFYRKTHMNHPCSKWVRESVENYNWLYDHFTSLCDEYTYRTEKVHLTDTKLRNVLHTPPTNIPRGRLTPFALCMPDNFKSYCPVNSYRNYYNSKSDKFKMVWTRRSIPKWFISNIP